MLSAECEVFRSSEVWGEVDVGFISVQGHPDICQISFMCFEYFQCGSQRTGESGIVDDGGEGSTMLCK